MALSPGMGSILGMLLGSGVGLAYGGIRNARDYNNYADTVNSGLDKDHQIPTEHKRFYIGNVKKQEDLLKAQYDSRIKQQQSDQKLQSFNDYRPEGVPAFTNPDVAAALLPHILTQQQKQQDAQEKSRAGIQQGHELYEAANRLGIIPMPAPGKDGYSELQPPAPELDAKGIGVLLQALSRDRTADRADKLVPYKVQTYQDRHQTASDNHGMVYLKRQNLQAGVDQKRASTAAIPQRLDIARQGLGLRGRSVSNAEANGAYQRSGGSANRRIITDEMVAGATPKDKVKAARIRLGLDAKPKAGGGSSGINWGAVSGKGGAFGSGPAPADKPRDVKSAATSYLDSLFRKK